MARNLENRNRYKPFAAVFTIIKDDNKVLLVLRKNSGYEDGQYIVPAGHLEQGETLIEAAIREAREESGIEVLPRDMKFVHLLHGKFPDREYLHSFFIAEKWTGTPKLCEPDKSDEVDWFELDNLPENTVDYVKHALKLVEQGEIYSEWSWNTT